MDLENQPTELFDSFIGRTIEDRYFIREKIGEGGIGSVYLAEDKRMVNRQVVVKVLLENWSKDEEVRRKFEHEKEALARLDHPGIVSILDAGILPENKPFIIMPFITGRTLRQVMEEQKKLPLNFCADVIESFCEALETAHDAGILHRDIKPENIILTEQADRKIRVRLIDFGIARVMNSQISPVTEVERSIGTVLYIAPEQLLGSSNQKPSADIYSCAIVAYEMLTGMLPFNPRSVVDMWQMQSDGVKLKPSAIRPELTTEVDNVILKALAYEPNERFQQVLAFGRELAHALRQLTLDSFYNFNPHISEVTIAMSGDKFSQVIEESKTAIEESNLPTFTEPKSPSSSFEVKIDQNNTNPLPRSQTQENNLKNLTAELENEKLKSEKSPVQFAPVNNKTMLLKTSIWAGVVGTVLLVIAAPLLFYMFYKPAVQTLPVEPKNTDIVVTQKPTQNLEFYLEIQKIRDNEPYGEPFRATGREIFETGWSFKINMTTQTAGNLYLFNEGKNDAGKNVFHLLFPTPAGQDGSPKVKADQQIKTGFYDLVGATGKEIIWIIWTKEAVPELEEIREIGLKTKDGEINDPQTMEKLRSFLQKYSGDQVKVVKDDEKQRTILQTSGDVIVYQTALEHR